MSLLPGLTFSAPGVTLYGGGGGGGSSSNIVASTITLDGSSAPFTATLPSGSNDGFEIRQGGGGSNVVVVATVDINNPSQAEFGVRSISSTSVVGRFEMDLTPSSGLASLNYQLYGSTLGGFDIGVGSATLYGQTSATGGAGNAIVLEGLLSSIKVNPCGRDLVPKKSLLGANFYLPPAGSSNITSFSTIAGHAYSMALPAFVAAVEPETAPAAGSWLSLDVDTAPSVSYLDTFDLASVSTVGNDFRCSRMYNFVASSSNHTLSVTTNNNISTLVECGRFVIEDLGIAFPQA
jgi:hypothetical protein